MHRIYRTLGRLNREFELHKIDTAEARTSLRGEGRSACTWNRGLLFLKPTNWTFLARVLFTYVKYTYLLFRIRPNVIHVHTCSYFGLIRSGIFLFLARPFGCRRILHLHNAIDNFYLENRDRAIFWKLISWSMSQADEYVVLSERLRVWMEANIGRSASVVWNACDSSKYQRHENDLEVFQKNFPRARGKVVVILVGGLYPHKGAFDLLEVAGLLHPTNGPD